MTISESIKRLVVSVIIAMFFGLPAATAQDSSATSDAYFSPIVIGYRKGNDKTQHYASELAEVFNTHAIGTDKNPVCCLWVEDWAPTSVQSGYLLLLQKHGGILYVTDAGAFEKAKIWIKSFPSSKEKGRLIPLGVKTTFKVINEVGSAVRTVE